MKMITRLFFFLLPLSANAQLFMDASANLPNNGANGASMDVRAADMDGDGDLDIVLANEFQPNTILLNDGNGVFSNGTAGNLPQSNHDSEDVAIGDFNGDGFLDLVFCSEDDVTLGWSNVHEYYLGNGQGSFSSASLALPDSEANAVITADISGDNLPDLLFGNNGGTGVLINDGNTDGSFSVENDRVPQIIRTTQDLALADVDGDGDLDLFEGNENGNLLHINDGTGHFANESDERLPAGLNIETRKVTFGDVDGDNDQDIFLSNVEFIQGKNRQNRLLINDGNGYFTDGTSGRLPSDFDHTIDAIFEDVDLDGDLDIVVANVFGGPVRLYENDGAGYFSDATFAVFGEFYVRDALGVVAADFNGDGFRDLYFCDRYQAQNNKKDLLLLRDASTSLSEVGDEIEISVYPNPVKDFFYIKTKKEIPDSVQLIDSTGGLVAQLKTVPFGSDAFRVELKSNLPTGAYFLQIELAGEKVVRKILVK